MDRVSSMDELADHFLAPQPLPMRLDVAAEEHEESSSSAATPAGSSTSNNKMMMNRSSSEWAFQRFLQEASALDDSSSQQPPTSGSATTSNDVVQTTNHSDFNINNNISNRKTAADLGGPPPANIPTDSEEYQAYLKSRLELACAAVALTRVFLFYYVILFLPFLFFLNMKIFRRFLCPLHKLHRYKQLSNSCFSFIFVKFLYWLIF